MADGIDIRVEGIGIVKYELGDLFNGNMQKSLNRHIGINVRERVADHLARASVTRHKSADRLGAVHSKFLEFAPARGQLRGGSKYNGPEDPPYTEVQNIKETGVDVVIGNTPGLKRAFGPLTIRPKRVKNLTIPLDRDSYNVSARDFPRELALIKSRRGSVLLVEEQTGKKAKKQRLRPKYLLVKKSVLKHDPDLLPNNNEITEWAEESTEAYLESLLK